MEERGQVLAVGVKQRIKVEKKWLVLSLTVRDKTQTCFLTFTTV